MPKRQFERREPYHEASGRGRPRICVKTYPYECFYTYPGPTSIDYKQFCFAVLA